MIPIKKKKERNCQRRNALPLPCPTNTAPALDNELGATSADEQPQEPLSDSLEKSADNPPVSPTAEEPPAVGPPKGVSAAPAAAAGALRPPRFIASEQLRPLRTLQETAAVVVSLAELRPLATGGCRGPLHLLCLSQQCEGPEPN
jgi:hypothetical protein